MKVYEIEPDKELNRCTEKDFRSVLPWLEDAEVGDIITIRVKEITEREYDALPEYMGP